MNNPKNSVSGENGSAAVKFLCIAMVIVMAANAGYNYIPVAYNGASFKQEMDTAVVKGLAASGQMKPLDIVTASVKRAAHDYNVPVDAFVEIKQENGVVRAHVAYTKQVPILPFGIYDYAYQFNYRATPTGYLLKDDRKP